MFYECGSTSRQRTRQTVCNFDHRQLATSSPCSRSREKTRLDIRVNGSKSRTQVSLQPLASWLEQGPEATGVSKIVRAACSAREDAAWGRRSQKSHLKTGRPPWVGVVHDMSPTNRCTKDAQDDKHLTSWDVGCASCDTKRSPTRLTVGLQQVIPCMWREWLQCSFDMDEGAGQTRVLSPVHSSSMTSFPRRMRPRRKLPLSNRATLASLCR
jgi:hypothetical protein